MINENDVLQRGLDKKSKSKFSKSKIPKPVSIGSSYQRSAVNEPNVINSGSGGSNGSNDDEGNPDSSSGNEENEEYETGARLLHDPEWVVYYKRRKEFTPEEWKIEQ